MDAVSAQSCCLTLPCPAAALHLLVLGGSKWTLVLIFLRDWELVICFDFDRSMLSWFLLF